MYLKPSEATASLQLSSQRKRDLLDHFEKNGDELDRWREFNAAYHADDRKFMQFLIPPGKRVLELGCGRGDLLAALKPSYGVGIDFSAETIAKANARHPDLHFVLGDVEDPQTLAEIEGPFDYIVIADTIGMFEDIDGTLRLVHHLCAPSTRIIISYYSHLWEPVLKLAEALHLRSKQPKINYIATADFLNQDGKGKGDAVRKGFAAATGDVLMILDADLTMPPELLPKYHAVIESGKADFVNGTRLIYPMEHEAMRPLNLIANRCFAYLFSYLVNTRLTDTLCGTKVLLRKDYEVLARERGYFGNFDPFGDFDLIFGAAKQNLKIIETPIHYKARTFGETQISRFRDGWLLLKMVWFAYRKLKAI